MSDLRLPFGDDDSAPAVEPAAVAARPRPVPADLVEKYGSNIFERFSGEMPSPVSEI